MSELASQPRSSSNEKFSYRFPRSKLNFRFLVDAHFLNEFHHMTTLNFYPRKAFKELNGEWGDQNIETINCRS